MGNFLGKFDHPLIFLFLMLIALFGLRTLVIWGGTEAGLNGLVAVVK